MAPTETLEAALERIKRHLRSHNLLDDDDELEMGNTVVALKDPYTSTRMAIPARFTDVSGAFNAFDLEPFLSMAERTRKWLDPVNSKPSAVQQLQVDSYLAAILAALEARADVTEVEVDQEGNWRPAGTREAFQSVLGGVPGAGSSTTERAAAGAAGSGIVGTGVVGDAGLSGEVMGAGGVVKLEPGVAAGAGAGGEKQADIDDDSEDEDEEEELR